MNYFSRFPRKIKMTWRLWKWQLHLQQQKRKIFSHYKGHPQDVDDEIKSALDYLKGKTLSCFPAPFSEDYHPARVQVFHDNLLGLVYVM